MPTVEEHKNLVKTIDTLALKRGEKKDKYYFLDTNSKEILEKAGMPNTENHWNYTVHVLKQYYPGSKWGRGSGDEGFSLLIKVRTK